ncbi:MAG: hypothetical protein R3C10_15975 [Pirellulales bacterium]
MVGTTEFIKLLAESQLVEPALLDRLRARVAKHGGKVDPRSIAKWLVDKGYLSLWQTRQLLAGHKAFYLGRYRLIDRIGKGGMGVVFKAEHALMQRTVALKVMSHRLLNNPAPWPASSARSNRFRCSTTGTSSRRTTPTASGTPTFW